MGLVDLAQDRSIEDAVAEADEGVEPVVGRALAALPKGEAVSRNNCIEAAIVDIPHIPLNGHEFVRVPLNTKPGLQILDPGERGIQPNTSIMIVREDLLDIDHRALHKALRYDLPFALVEIVLALLEDHIAGIVVLPRIKRAHVVAVVVEEVQGDLLAAQELHELFVDADLAEDHHLARVLHRDVLLLSLLVLKVEGVLLAVKLTIGEYVDRPLHAQQNSLYAQ
jgi:hypothetical protein